TPGRRDNRVAAFVPPGAMAASAANVGTNFHVSGGLRHGPTVFLKWFDAFCVRAQDEWHSICASSGGTGGIASVTRRKRESDASGEEDGHRRGAHCRRELDGGRCWYSG